MIFLHTFNFTGGDELPLVMSSVDTPFLVVDVFTSQRLAVGCSNSAYLQASFGVVGVLDMCPAAERLILYPSGTDAVRRVVVATASPLRPFFQFEFGTRPGDKVADSLGFVMPPLGGGGAPPPTGGNDLYTTN